ncbi:hypothetical protein COZ78_01300 [bacterium (Candidatus Gribaldobacteria) CG_4_8_14_3_um_filter_42_11]|uniref:Uncharacterized protein n=1 Tax=bacterium (Candidatus Gribaldobacteria) CG_4_8_14_3_um_filter_42_11 TaxID=2014267 RepID=A0A2M7IYI3_9BACT|nr:MAG: hypothetical protein COT36_00400 [Parcubacteria group bacterium CG08_land_8_20_14_0_20_38_56]PIX03253.1 MAG: hypothetical protein COZ78_01300 [bacterium (Candidatus Gribaldobacteria) CG_4_8_14_3_um_filter_42_11]
MGVVGMKFKNRDTDGIVVVIASKVAPQGFGKIVMLTVENENGKRCEREFSSFYKTHELIDFGIWDNN